MRREDNTQEEIGRLNVGKDRVSEAKQDKAAAAELRHWGHCVRTSRSGVQQPRVLNAGWYNHTHGGSFFNWSTKRSEENPLHLEAVVTHKTRGKAKEQKSRRAARVESNANRPSAISHVSHVSLTPISSAEWEWTCATVCRWRAEGIKHLATFANENQSVKINSVLNRRIAARFHKFPHLSLN